MRSCTRIPEVEDMVLGLIGGDEARELAAHLAACAACRAERDAFVAERALFLARAPLVAPPAVHRVAGKSNGPGAFVALACAAAVVLAGNVGALRVDATIAPAPREPMASFAPAEPMACDDPRQVERAPAVDRAVCEERVTSSSVGP